jgi:hypothetical protein
MEANCGTRNVTMEANCGTSKCHNGSQLRYSKRYSGSQLRYSKRYNGSKLRYSKRYSVHGIWWLSAGVQLHTGRDEMARSRELFSAQHSIDAQHQTPL